MAKAREPNVPPDKIATQEGLRKIASEIALLSSNDHQDLNGCYERTDSLFCIWRSPYTKPFIVEVEVAKRPSSKPRFCNIER